MYIIKTIIHQTDFYLYGLYESILCSCGFTYKITQKIKNLKSEFRLFKIFSINTILIQHPFKQTKFISAIIA